MDDDLFEEQSALKKSPEKKSEDIKESSDLIGCPVLTLSVNVANSASDILDTLNTQYSLVLIRSSTFFSIF